MKYCDVIVDITAQAVDRRFTYAVPEGMNLTPGQRVMAPFGPRPTEGYVLALKDETDLPLEKIRPVLRALEDYPAILPEMIDLAEWMRERYRCSLADALRLMIPAQLRGSRVREKTVRVVSLNVPPERLEEEIARRARAPRQQQILRLLAGGPQPAPVLNAPGVLNALEKAGLVRIEQQESLRTPYRALDAARAREPGLTYAQQRAVETISGAPGGRFLLNGVTGSGKTEVYIRLIRRVLQAGRSAIVLVPEIALTPQMVDWFRARFGDDAAVLHSSLSSGERFDEWRRVRQGRARVVVGARSAVFAPAENLGLIVVDEEHEHTYQSDKHPRYDAREVARRRCEMSGATLVLGSATPSIASYMRTMPSVRPENRLTLVELSQRIPGSRLPEVQVVDMREELLRGNHSIFSAALQSALTECVRGGRQAILFINRRGYSSFVSCRACGYVAKCENCDVSLTYHQSDDLLRCHYCGAAHRPPATCPQCGSPYIKYFGAGTQKVEAEAQALLPEAQLMRMDNDTTRGKDMHEKLLSRFRRGEAQVLVGTQMIAKGLDFPNVTLVGVISADMTLNLPDYRSPERTFQLLTQVAGRAGRASQPGRVVIQTYEPDHYAVQLAARQDYRAFYQEEVKRRRRALYPPFTLLARLLCVSRDPDVAPELAQRLETQLNDFLDAPGGPRADAIQMRALEAPIARLQGMTRWQVFIKMYARGRVEEVLSCMQALAQAKYPGATVELEVNPVNML